MKKILFVIDMQNDFVDGALGTKEAQAILPAVIEKVKSFDGRVIFTRDTHSKNYLETQEGKKLPVVHCVRGTDGWQIVPTLDDLRLDIGALCID
ncbi:MAG: cysteine hydrolase, partial [Clostridia bacterium]|nr:cysteine hydrolase [Clostridia bacterium]